MALTGKYILRSSWSGLLAIDLIDLLTVTASSKRLFLQDETKARDSLYSWKLSLRSGIHKLSPSDRRSSTMTSCNPWNNPASTKEVVPNGTG
jgi:hypothetical protein